jgi:hypothetical protein
MPITVNENESGKVLEVQVQGRLSHEDYLGFVPKFDAAVRRHGRVRLLFDMVDFHGWQPSALWDEFKLDVKYFTAVERFALVGDQAWEKALSVLSRPFTTAQIRYFDRGAIEAARTWLREPASASPAKAETGERKPGA